MIQMINKLKKNQKGFTLVELIVVLVILAILAAFTIPAMLGFVDDARGKAAIAQAREVYVAAQSATTSAAVVPANVGGTPTQINNNGKEAIRTQMQSYLNGDITISNAIMPDGNIVTTGVALEGETAIKGAITGDTKIYLVLGQGSEVAQVKQVIYLDPSGKYVCSITANDQGSSAEFFKK